MKKMITFFSEINKKGLLTIIPLVVVLFHLAMPAAMSANVALSSSFSLEKWPVASEAWPSEAWPESSSLNAVSAKWPASEEAWLTLENSFITIRTVVLHPVDGRKGASISADVVYNDDEYKIAYQNVYYKITPLSGHPGYDCQVLIGGFKYMFHLKLHPYE